MAVVIARGEIRIQTTRDGETWIDAPREFIPRDIEADLELDDAAREALEEWVREACAWPLAWLPPAQVTRGGALDIELTRYRFPAGFDFRGGLPGRDTNIWRHGRECWPIMDPRLFEHFGAYPDWVMTYRRNQWPAWQTLYSTRAIFAGGPVNG